MNELGRQPSPGDSEVSSSRLSGRRRRTTLFVLRALLLALTFVGLLVVAYQSRVDWRSHARGARELLSSNAGPVKFPLPEDKTRAPRDVVTVAILTLSPPPVFHRAADESPTPAAPSEDTPGHPLRAPPLRLS